MGALNVSPAKKVAAKEATRSGSMKNYASILTLNISPVTKALGQRNVSEQVHFEWCASVCKDTRLLPDHE